MQESISARALAARGADDYAKRRKKENRELFKVFRHPVIEDVAKANFFKLFSNQCFKCHSHDSMTMDHHIPFVLGGHSVPGNLVALCKRCNDRKGTSPPDLFYTAAEIEALMPLLEAQKEIFSFVFDWQKWNADPESYLVSLGVAPDLAYEIFHNPDHRYYMPPRDQRLAVQITFELPPDFIPDLE